ncbi:uncharacterized protein LOC135368924 isoform X3 [Ornithodoros turicata]|uniref:uncharacterized protein LOC135368924 isoform X3 n=1 Tax=Ornithodoros turicata TaxID=34597 RepID=UPI003139B762
MRNDRVIIIDEPSDHQSNDKGHRSSRDFTSHLWTSLPSKKILFTLIVAAAFCVLMVFFPRAWKFIPIFSPPWRRPGFYGADNYTGFSSYVVPNVIHYVRFGQPNVTFMDAVSMRSAYINHAPDHIVVHCDECLLDGPHSHLVRDIPIIKFDEILPPMTIFGREVNWIEHASDVARIQILLKSGGIYLDNDCIVVRPLHQFRHFETSIGWSPEDHMGNMVILAATGARFLQLYQELYREYNNSLWYYNAGFLPTVRLLRPYPHLVHAVPSLFAVDATMLRKLYTPGERTEWRSYFVVHTYIRHRYLPEDPLYGQKIDLQNVRTYDTHLGEMVREVLFGTSEFVSDETEVQPVTDLYAAKRLGRNRGRLYEASIMVEAVAVTLTMCIRTVVDI